MEYLSSSTLGRCAGGQRHRADAVSVIELEQVFAQWRISAATPVGSVRNGPVAPPGSGAVTSHARLPTRARDRDELRRRCARGHHDDRRCRQIAGGGARASSTVRSTDDERPSATAPLRTVTRTAKLGGVLRLLHRSSTIADEVPSKRHPEANRVVR
jgi:hypothetical protein